MQKVDIIIPLYKPGKELFSLLERLKKQTVSVRHIILANTEEKYFEELVRGTTFWADYGKLVSVFHVTKQEFDHGRTRHLAVQRSDADVFVAMTQDALPADEFLIENLLKGLEQEKVAVAYARQLPTPDCSFVESYTRQFNYPEESRIKTLADLENLGIKTYFCSNVCAAYKRNVYEEMGGFIRHTIFNEDMIFAAGAVSKGYGIAYVAEAKVVHSHNYTNMQQLRRNFDLGVSQADHPGIFVGVPSEKEGKKLVSMTTSYLMKNKKWYLIPHFYVQCFFRYAGFLLGKHYRILPNFLIKGCTMNKQYWQ